jgi:hypothetical protein
MIFKINNAYKNQVKILNAIKEYAYSTNQTERALAMIISMEDFDDTIYRLTDWGCKRILPNEYYQEIKPYIQ